MSDFLPELSGQQAIEPHNAEAEQAVLGSILMNQAAFFEVSFLSPEDFYIHKNGWMFQAIKNLIEKNKPVDSITLCDEMGLRLQEAGGAAYIVQLMSAVPTSVHAASYGKMVEEESIRRKMLVAASNIAMMANDDRMGIQEVLSGAENTIRNASTSRKSEDRIPDALKKEVLNLLGRGEKVALGVLERVLGKKKADLALGQLLSKGLVTRSQELEGVRVKPRVLPYLHLGVDVEAARQEARHLVARAPKQAALLEFLASRRKPVSLAEVREAAHCTPAIAKALQGKGLISIEGVQVWRDPLLDRSFSPSAPPPLTAAQEAALDQIRISLRQPGGSSPAVFLLHGVTAGHR